MFLLASVIVLQSNKKPLCRPKNAENRVAGKNINICYQRIIRTYRFDAKPFCLKVNNISKPAKAEKVMNFYERTR